ncbi:MAG: amidohydrolase family protein [Phycisphaerae bacterium]
MATVLQNALLVDLDPMGVARGGLRVEDGRITESGEEVRAAQEDEVLDCDGAVVLAGLVNGHTHLYSALAAGMPAPPKQPRNFHEILKYVWWRLDRALDAESIEMSGRIGALDALRCGTTTLIDHHASPEHIGGSLDLIERGIADVGLRGVLCYETTDRNGRAGRDEGLAENRRYLEKCKASPSGRFAALVGAHASFTVDDDTLDALARLADEFDSGVHIHVAEDPCDEEFCRRDHGVALMDRLVEHGILRAGSIFAHGTHLSSDAIARMNDTSVSLAHNPRSNMNNAVGYTPIGEYKCPVLLGTDGIGADMFTESKTAWFKSCDGGAGLSPADVLQMMASAARRASDELGVKLGSLSVGSAADVVVTNYRPATPLTGDNLAGHFIFAMGPQHVRHVMVNGVWALRDGVVRSCDETTVRVASGDVAAGLWKRMERF